MAHKRKEGPTVAECPAYEQCKSTQKTCGECMKMDIDIWKAHVKTVLASKN